MKITTAIACAAAALSSVAFGSIFATGSGPQYKVQPGESVMLSVKVATNSPKASPNLQVIVDLGPVGGDMVKLNDNGAGGDAVAGDGVFSLKVQIPANAPTGLFYVKFLATDNRGSTFADAIPLSIREVSPR